MIRCRTTLACLLGAALFTGAGYAAAQTPLADVDATFIDNAVQGSRTQIQAGEIALDTSDSPHIKEFAQTVVEDRTTMLDELTELAEAKGHSVPDDPSMTERAEILALRALSGGAFDTMYVDRIALAPHEATIKLFEEAEQQAQDADVKAYAEKNLPQLRRHFEMAQHLEGRQRARNDPQGATSQREGRYTLQ